MGIIAFVLGFLAITQAEAVQEFGKHSNGNRDYSLIVPQSCSTGLRDSGYALALGGGVILKQNDADGSHGDICAD